MIPANGRNPKDDSPFGFIPTLWICALFIALFSLTTLLHAGQAIRYKVWWALPTFALCGLGEVVGWSGRLWGSQNPWTMNPYLMQITSTIISPTFLTAGMFFSFGRIINLVGSEYSRLTPKMYSWIFLTLDLIALVVQSVGGAQASSAETQAGSEQGAKIMVGGIILQMAAITLYCIVQAEWLWRVFKNKPLRPAASASEPTGIKGTSTPTVVGEEEPKLGAVVRSDTMLTARQKITKGIKTMLIGLVIATIFVYVRSIYRTIELLDGWNGPIITNERLFNVLDGMPIFMAMFTLNVLHIGRLVPLTPAPVASSV